MSFMDSIFGQSGGIPGWLKSYLQGGLSQWNTARDQMYSPEAQRRKVASWGENFDRTLETQNAAIGKNLNRRGFAGNPGGNYLPAMRARGMADQRSKVADWANAGMMNSIMPPWLQTVIQALYKQPSGGLMGSIGPAMGAAAAGAMMSNSDAQNPNAGTGTPTTVGGTTRPGLTYQHGQGGFQWNPASQQYEWL